MAIINLDNRAELETLDAKNMLKSIEILPNQVREVMLLSETVRIPKKYSNSDNIVVLGMGGSALGTHIIKSVFFNELNRPVEIVNGYHLPAYVGKDTLVLLSSYSGGTEEVLSAALEAKKTGANIMVITAGGKLADFAKKNNWPALVFTTKNNPCGSPRIGLGYSLVGQMILFAKAGLFDFKSVMVTQILKTLEKYNDSFGVENSKNNLAKQIAGKVRSRTVWFVGAEHLSGSTHVAANQLNENAKRFGGYFLLPELNHHLMEGLVNPVSNSENICFVLLESALYDKRVQKRFAVMKEILTKNKIEFIVYNLESKTKLNQAMECLSFGSYVSFYLAMLQGIDPTAIPFVDYFKAALKK